GHGRWIGDLNLIGRDGQNVLKRVFEVIIKIGAQSFGDIFCSDRIAVPPEDAGAQFVPPKTASLLAPEFLDGTPEDHAFGDLLFDMQTGEGRAYLPPDHRIVTKIKRRSLAVRQRQRPAAD